MPDITIDPGAVQTARVSLLIVRDTLNGLYAQHQNVFSEIEGMLNNVTTSAMETFDPFGIWERFGFDRASRSCQSIRGTLEQARGDTDQATERLCETHSSQLAKVIENHSGELRSSIASALDSLWTIASLLDMGNIGRIIRDPGLIHEHFDNSRRALHNACTQAQTLVDYLTRLQHREETLVGEITNTFTGTVPPLTGAYHGGPLTIGQASQAESSVLQDSLLDLEMDKPLPTSSIAAGRAAIIAQEVTSWLTMGKDDVGIHGHNHIDWNKVPGGKDGPIAKQLQTIFGEAPGDWLFGNDKYNPDVQCVALVSLSYQIATGNFFKTWKNPGVMPPLGNADKLWKAYANNAVPGWNEVTNKAGSAGWPPRVGDVMVSTSRDHVAIVTNVATNPDGSVASITIAQANTKDVTQTYKVADDRVDPSAGADGFLRYTG